MTKIRIMSDLHLEFGPLDLKPIGEDILILGGDIGIFTNGAKWGRAYARKYDIVVLMIAGNHEFYCSIERGEEHTYESTLAALRRQNVKRRNPGKLNWKDIKFFFLEQDKFSINDIDFYGTTLWTDFSKTDPWVILNAQRQLNDYRLIYTNDHKNLSPHRVTEEHQRASSWLEQELQAEKRERKRVVITHHLPSFRSVPLQYKTFILNDAYASHLDELVERSEADLWIHGHTHTSCDYLIAQTRVICNPRGYYPYDLNPTFNPDLMVEV